MQQLFEGYRGSCVTSVDQDTPNKTSGGSGDADMFSDYGTFLSSRQTHEEKSQLDLYLAEPTRDINEKLDVLDYWSKASARYPEVAVMARDILAIPVSSVASESAFSTSRKVITHTRSSLGFKTVEALMCLQDWFREKMDEGKFTYNKFVGFCCFHYLLLSTNHPCFLCAESGIMWVTVGSAGRPAGRRVGLRAGSGQHFRIFAGPRAGSGHEFFYRVFFGPTRTRPDPRNAQV